MKIVIAYQGIKRAIDGDFMLCLSADEAKVLRDALDAKIATDFSYGWIEVRDPLPVIPNLKPIPWTQEVNHV